ncbi:hypothetical protein ACF0H5_016749 [Mactra antiquata]
MSTALITSTLATSKNYRCYSPTSLINAMEKIRQTGAPIKTTARQFGVPESSLCHRLSGRVDPEATHSGPQPLFSMEEEHHYVEHIKFMSDCGYGYSRSEVVDMATEYAISLEKRDKDHPLTFKWFRGFMSRWPELKLSEVLQQEIQEQSQINNYTVSGSSTADFFRSKEANIIAKKPATKKRRCLSRVVSGKAITEDMVISQIIDHENTTTQKRKQNKSKEPSVGPSKLQTLNPSVVISDSVR